MKQRIITGVVLGSLVLLAIFCLNNTMFNSLVAALLLLAAWEWSAMVNAKRLLSRFLYLIITALLIIISSYFTFSVLLFSAVFWLFGCMLIYGYSRQHFNNILPQLRYIMGFLVIVPFAVAISLLHNSQPPLLLMVLITVTFADSGAYFIGKKYGKHQLAPQISPKKTTEGLLGGILVGGSAGIISSLWVDATITQHIVLIVLTFIIIIIALLGDLLESMIKRICGIKDSGDILPGHGGLLDRLDSVLASVPCFALCAVLLELIAI